MASEKKAKTAREALLMAAELLSKRGAWTKGRFAANRSGNAVDWWSRDAICFCVDGALMRVSKASSIDLHSHVYFDAVNLLNRVINQSWIAWNDSQRSKRPVIAALRKAAEL